MTLSKTLNFVFLNHSTMKLHLVHTMTKMVNSQKKNFITQSVTTFMTYINLIRQMPLTY